MTASATMTADPARMRPLFFEGRFAWLHGAAAPGGVGVVMCSALAQEEVCTRYGAMLLADRLGAVGVPTLRFDYRGTGDSIAADLTIDGMIADIARAADCLRQEAAVGTVILCGFRFGGMLALKAAAEMVGIGGLALLAPVTSGAAYMRDLKVSVRFSPLAQLDPVPAGESPALLNTNGFHWSRSLRDRIGALDAAALPAPTVPTLIAAHHAGGRANAVAAAWRAAGTPVIEHDFADYPAFMRDPTTHVMPAATFAAVERWILAQPPTSQRVASRAVAVTSQLILDDCEEIPLRLSEGEATFGILCRPRGRAGAEIGALMLHEGSSHRIGNGGAQVPLARRLAAQGYPSLRVDLTGMGDSPCAPGGGRPFSDPARVREVVAAIDALAEEAPGGIVASGLCSGAEMAFHASLADRRVIGTLLVNMPAIGWDPAGAAGSQPPPAKRTLRSYRRAIRAGGLRRVVRGDVDLLKVAGALRRQVSGDVARRLGKLTRREAEPARGRVRRQMSDLAERGVRTLFVFSDDDPGLSEVRAQLGEAAGVGLARIAIFADADHHFNGLGIRCRYNDLYMQTIDELAMRHPAAATVAKMPVTGGRAR